MSRAQPDLGEVGRPQDGVHETAIASRASTARLASWSGNEAAIGGKDVYTNGCTPASLIGRESLD
jgi:hypothetical protein